MRAAITIDFGLSSVNDCGGLFAQLLAATKPTLSGGSLGSWVDEERSKMRVAVLTAGHDHRHFERTLRPGRNPLATPV